MIQGMHELKLESLTQWQNNNSLIAMHNHIYTHVGAFQKVRPKLSSQNYYF